MAWAAGGGWGGGGRGRGRAPPGVGGCGAVVEAFDELEDDHLPLLLRQVFEGELELPAVEGAFGEGLGAYLHGSKGLREVNLAAASATAVEVYQLVAGDAEHPGGERHTPELVLLNGLQELEHHFGRQVLSGLDVAEVEEGVVVDPRGVGGGEGREGGLLPGLGAR